MTLTGSFSWFPELDTPTHTLVVSNELGLFTISQSFFGVPPTDDLVPVTLNLMGTTTDHFVLDFVTGTSFINDRVDFDLLSLSALPDQIIAVGPNSQIVNLQGTVTYDYTPAVSSVPESSHLGDDAARVRWPGLRVPPVTQGLARLATSTNDASLKRRPPFRRSFHNCNVSCGCAARIIRAPSQLSKRQVTIRRFAPMFVNPLFSNHSMQVPHFDLTSIPPQIKSLPIPELSNWF